MSIDRVTITGADDSIEPVELIELTERFPFVEWGILVSSTRHGSPRYPTGYWIDGLKLLTRVPHKLPLSLHVCGKWTRLALLGVDALPAAMLNGFQRVQLNFHAERTECRPQEFAELLKSWIDKYYLQGVIFQLDGADGNKYLDAANEHEVKGCYGLFDVSGGAGIVPAEWPRPIYLDVHPGEHGEGVEQWAYHGYAGGLGPHNLEQEIPRILAAAAGTEHTHEGRIWLDMETRVRSAYNRQFDLAKVRRCLEICQPFTRK